MARLPEQTTKRAAIYVRVSSRAQEEDGTSLDTQEAAARRQATDRGYALDDAHVYREVHTGTELWERPQLTALRESVRRRAVDVVIVYAIDRLSRDPVHLGVVLSEADHAGVAVEFVTEPLDDSPEGQLIRFVRGYAAKVEHEKIKERSLRGKRARVESGRPLHGGRPLYGYRWRDAEKTRLEVDPVTAAVVRRIFAEASAGRPLLAIAKALTSEGIPTPKGRERWAETTIAYVLHHPGYKGEAIGWRTKRTKVGGRWHHEQRDPSEWVRQPQGTIPPLVDAATWQGIQAILTNNKRRSARRNSNPKAFLLRGGYAVCGTCGRPLAASTATGEGRPTRLRYRCINGPRGAVCDAPALVDAAALDAMVWQRIAYALAKPEVIAAELAKTGDQVDDTAADREAVERRLQQIARSQANLSRALAALDDEEAQKPLLADLKDLSDEKAKLEAQREELNAKRARQLDKQARIDALFEWCVRVRSKLNTATYERRRLALDALGVSVRVPRGASIDDCDVQARVDLAGLTDSNTTTGTVDSGAFTVILPRPEAA